MTSWRFIDSGPLDGASNMAVDEALLNGFDPESSLPVFRIYGWEPPALSLGRFQKAEEVLDPVKCRTAGVGVVRRITGGGVIYHAGEITYSLVCSPRHIPPAASIKESFRVLTSFLISFYGRLGLEPLYAMDCSTHHFPIGGRSPFCFGGREGYDILIDGRKIGGNAQRRLKNVIFQHGSIPLVNRAMFGASLLREPPAGIDEGVTSLRDLGVKEGIDRLKRLMAGAFAEAVPAILKEDTLAEEERVAVSLAVEKHSSASWVWEGTYDKEL